jgi:hypothetical protein
LSGSRSDERRPERLPEGLSRLRRPDNELSGPPRKGRSGNPRFKPTHDLLDRELDHGDDRTNGNIP